MRRQSIFSDKNIKEIFPIFVLFFNERQTTPKQGINKKWEVTEPRRDKGNPQSNDKGKFPDNCAADLRPV